MAFIKPRKTERKNQMHYCELKNNKANTVALIHNVYIVVLHSTVASISLYYQKFLILWSLAFPPLPQRIRGEVATSSLVFFENRTKKIVFADIHCHLHHCTRFLKEQEAITCVKCSTHEMESISPTAYYHRSQVYHSF